jgi:hypothetical protein
VPDSLPKTAIYGAYDFATLVLRASGAVGATHSMAAGGSSNLLEGWESGTDEKGVMYPNQVQDADIEFTAQLMDLSDAAPVAWIGHAQSGEGGRVRRISLNLGPADDQLHPPPAVEHGGTGSIGHTRMSNLEVLYPAIDRQVLDQLVAEGFVAMGANASKQQLKNYREFLRVTEKGYREQRWAALDGHGIWPTFERRNPSIGTVDRITVQWTTATLDGLPATHEGDQHGNRTRFARPPGRSRRHHRHPQLVAPGGDHQLRSGAGRGGPPTNRRARPIVRESDDHRVAGRRQPRLPGQAVADGEDVPGGQR